MKSMLPWGLLAILVAACSDESTNGEGTGGGSVGTGGGATTTAPGAGGGSGTGGNATSGPGGSGGGETALEGRTGFERLALLSDPGTVVATSASAAFWQGDAEADCAEEIVAGCSVFTCAGSAPTAQPVSAGSVTFTWEGGARSFELGDDGRYGDTLADLEDLLAEGSTVEVSATGDVVPEFSSSLAVPSRLVLDAPSFADPPRVVRADGVALTWVGGAAGAEVFAHVSSAEASMEVVCRASVDDGAMEIPAEALQRLPTTSDGFVYVAASAQTETLAGPATIVTYVADFVVLTGVSLE